MPSFSIEEFRTASLPSEAEIMDSWVLDRNTVAVSVVCLTYNQRGYIEDALRGFLIQKTTFPFEVIVHDDASTDGTNEIVRHYARRYPKIIKTILQTENQYSKLPNSVVTNALEAARGTYIAICEGDDFWTNHHKLQRQYDALEQTPGVNLCVHRSFEIREGHSPRAELQHIKDGEEQRLLSLRVVIEQGGGMINTASLFIRRTAVEHLPAWFADCPVADIYLKIFSARHGGAIYLPEPMCVYRVGAAGSWTENLYSKYEEFVRNQECGLLKLEGVIDRKHARFIRRLRGRLALSASSFYLSMGHHKEAWRLAVSSILLTRRLKKLAVHNLFLSAIRVCNLLSWKRRNS